MNIKALGASLCLVFLTTLVSAQGPRLQTNNQGNSWTVFGDPQPITVLSIDGGEFVRAFNATSDRVRVVTVFSPSCPHCLRGASDLLQILQQYPEKKMKVFILWSPILGPDTKPAASQASAYLAEPRAEHFWDLWSFGSRKYSEHFNYPPGQIAWDIQIVYEPGVKWGEKAPRQFAWFQSHDVVAGPKYAPDKLAAEIAKLVR